jgi:hypothetical protein
LGGLAGHSFFDSSFESLIVFLWPNVRLPERPSLKIVAVLMRFSLLATFALPDCWPAWPM